MDKNAIKKYAVWARRELIERVSQKALQYGIMADGKADPNADSVNGRLLTDAEKKQRGTLISKVNEHGYEQVIEEVAYTWFNRFAALRFMEVNGYLPSHVRVFTNDADEFKPQILSEAIYLDLDGLNMDKVYELKSADKDEELFKYLLGTQCNALSSILPKMFQRIADDTELLLPDYLLREGSVIHKMIDLIPEEDWRDQVQIIGWLYQYYNTEPKDKVFAGLKKNVKITRENIPAATQLFTPDWIVRYMVENSLGRLWLEGHPNDALKSQWKYYLDEAEQEAEVQAQLDAIRREYAALKPEDIKCIDPCMGSGHILCYLFDVLVQIYEEYGHTAREAVSSIVEKNLWGLDIDDRAAQLAYFAVMMKARQYDRRFFAHPVQPNVYAIQESNWIGGAFPFDMGDFLLSKEHQETLNYLIDSFHDAKEYGSILHLEQRDYAGFIEAWELTASQTAENVGLLLWYDAIKDAISELAKIAIALTQKYHVVCTNPPYMSASGMNGRLAEFIKKNYPDSKSDASTAFMERTLQFCRADGFMSMINIPVWMFLSSYEKLREKMIKCNTFINMVHPGRGIFGSDFGTTTFVIHKAYIPGYVGSYRRLFEKQGEVESIEEREQVFLAGKGSFTAQQDNFSKIPGAPVAYWVSEATYTMFDAPLVMDIFIPKFGMSTGDGERFVRFWYEEVFTNIAFKCENENAFSSTGKEWCVADKGGNFRRWYGNKSCVIWWKNNGIDIKTHKKSAVRSPQFFFRPHISWTLVSSGNFSARYFEEGYLLDTASNCLYFDTEKEEAMYALAYLNSVVASYGLNLLNPTINMSCGVLGNLPYIESNIPVVSDLADYNVSLSKADWDSFETSWDFQSHPLAPMAYERQEQLSAGMNSKERKKAVTLLSERFRRWEQECEYRFSELKKNEEELNRIFIDIYGLQDELTPEVEDKDVTVRKADLGRDIRSLISYAVGCMFGRYSLDVEGLAYAGGEWDASKYKSFQPDKDAIIPICDDEYFDDDIVGRFVKFIEVVYGRETLEENLKFIADALGGKGSPREVIRKYFLNDFYADHCKIYQKRPIYWLFDSGKKNGFKCLIYLHRYQPDTVARIRTDYIHEQQARYRAAIADLEQRINGASTSERVKLNKRLAALQAQAAEIREYEEKIHHLADQMIKIDLDDGVKKNYAIFQDVLAKIK